MERWIQAGRPLQLPSGTPIDRRRRFQTALEIALDRRDHSLVLLLLGNGYDQAAEPECPLDTALRLRRQNLLDLLLEWGADPQRVCLDTLCDTYDSELYERFRNLGVDFTSDHALAYGLGYHTSNKPLFGFAKRHLSHQPEIQAELDIALAHHAGKGNEKGVMLCLWAGANAHAVVPALDHLGLGYDDEEDMRSSAIYQACSSGHVDILERLRPDPVEDDYDELYRSAPNEKVVGLLAQAALPRDPSRVVKILIARSAWRWSGDRPVETLRALFEAGVRWRASSTQEIADARRDLFSTSDDVFVDLMKILATDDYCSREVLVELARTPSIRKRMKTVGLIPPTWKEPSTFDWSRPAMGRECLARFGIKLKAEKPAIPRTVRIGSWSGDGRQLRLGRSVLFKRVWSMPVANLAKEWGLSGRGLTKACRRLRIPVPPRGYWAKVAAGQRIRRPKLPALPPGQGEEILICVPEPTNAD